MPAGRYAIARSQGGVCTSSSLVPHSGPDGLETSVFNFVAGAILGWIVRVKDLGMSMV
jgi:hypothetical protein